MSNSTVVNGLLNESHRIFNIDESWFSPSDEKREKVIVGRCQKNANKVIFGISEHITMVMGASAAGTWLPPFFYFQGRTANNR